MGYKYINTEYLDSVTGGDTETVKELVVMFREQVAEFCTEMQKLLEKNDFHTLGLLAHKAKSSVAIMGMEDLALMLKNFELQAKEGKEQERFETYINRFRNDTGEAVKELEDMLDKRLKQG